MSAASSRSEAASIALQPVRVGGGLSVVLAARGAITYPARVAEADGWRVRFPNSPLGCEAVMINTGGGVAGGDTVRIAVEVGAGAAATVTSAAAERVYRALDKPATITVALSLAAGSSLTWLPLETILSSGAALHRRVEIDMAEDATLTFADSIVLGRRASGETMLAGAIRDRWMVRRGGRPIHAEAIRMDGAIGETMQRAATGGGAHVIATLVHVAPDACDRLPAVRAALAGADTARAAASAWDGRLVVRVLATRSDHARSVIAAAASALAGRAMPRAWTT